MDTLDKIDLLKSSISFYKEEIERMEKEIKSLENDKELRITYKGVNFDFVKIPTQEFIMGNEFFGDELPLHKVKLTEFYISKHPITIAQWKTLKSKNTYNIGKGDPSEAVTNVSFEEIMSYIHKLNKRTKHKYNFNLPTEAQLELVKDVNFFKDMSFEEMNKYVNLNSQDISVCTRLPNSLGVYDTQGFLREYVLDFYDTHYYRESPYINPCNTKGNSVVLKGKNKMFDKNYFTFRTGIAMDAKVYSSTFRLVINKTIEDEV